MSWVLICSCSLLNSVFTDMGKHCCRFPPEIIKDDSRILYSLFEESQPISTKLTEVKVLSVKSVIVSLGNVSSSVAESSLDSQYEFWFSEQMLSIACSPKGVQLVIV